MPSVRLLCLGVGRGVSYVMRGVTSTAFAVFVDEVPFLLVDCGVGVVRASLQHLGLIPGRMYLTHNHADHTGDLPVAMFSAKTPVQLLGHMDVLAMVREHRFHDAPAIQGDLINIPAWVPANETGHIMLERGLSLRLFRARHDYTCYGFVMYQGNMPLFGYSGDSAFDKTVYETLAQAPIAVVDGREDGNHDHASFEQIDAFAAKNPACRFYVVHYEASDAVFKSKNVQLWRVGESIQVPNGLA